MRYNMDMLKDGLDRLADAKWATPAVEQGHGSMAHIHRVHKEFGPSMLCTRAFLHNIRLLLPLETAEEKLARRQVLAMQKLLRKSPWKLGGRHEFFKGLVASATEALGGQSLRQSSKEYIMSTHSRMYKGLPQEQKDIYEARAQASMTKKNSTPRMRR